MLEPPREIRELVQTGPVVPFLAIKQSSFQLILNEIGQNWGESARQVDGKGGFRLSVSCGLFITHSKQRAAIFKPQNTIFCFIFTQESCESAVFDLCIEHAVICDRGEGEGETAGCFPCTAGRETQSGNMRSIGALGRGCTGSPAKAAVWKCGADPSGAPCVSRVTIRAIFALLTLPCPTLAPQAVRRVNLPPCSTQTPQLPPILILHHLAASVISVQAGNLEQDLLVFFLI